MSTGYGYFIDSIRNLHQLNKITCRPVLAVMALSERCPVLVWHLLQNKRVLS